ncbi:hypothetical protein M422DRAFT_27569 [Sphaerobolus stellatus SS14]|nr:hypothetical protein M422DRAFT_27569 [Sphaerobolus stellatus SS14]
MTVPTANLENNNRGTCKFKLPIGWSASILVAFISTNAIIVFSDENDPSKRELKPGQSNRLTITRPRHVPPANNEQQFTIKIKDEGREFELQRKPESFPNFPPPEVFYLYFGNGNDDNSRTSCVVVHVFPGIPLGKAGGQ